MRIRQITARMAMAVAIAASLTAVAPVSPAAAAAPTAPYTAFTIGGRWDAAGTPATSSLAFLWFERGVEVRMTMPDGAFYFASIKAPLGKSLSLGTFPAQATPDADHAELVISGPNGPCTTHAGSFTVTEITRNTETNVVTALAISYEETNCHPARGEVRYNSSKAYSAAVAGGRAVSFGLVNAGENSSVISVVIRSLGPKDLWFGPGVLGGANPTAFQIVSDTCSGGNLAYDQTCAVNLVAKPRALGELPATFTLPSNTVGGKETFQLSLKGVESNRGTFKPLSPSRILDTREGNGAPTRPVGPNSTIDLQVTGRGNVPASGVSAVVLNVTVVLPTAWSYVTVWPTGVARPVASSLNFGPGWIGANSVTVAVGQGGKVSLFNASGNTHLVADVVGWYADSTIVNDWDHGGGLLPMSPERWLDTRDPDWPHGKPSTGDALLLRANFVGMNDKIKAWVVNVTSTEAETPGYLTTWDGNEFTLPEASTLNLVPGQAVPNLAVVPARQCFECPAATYGWSTIGVYVSGVTHVIIDIFAVYDDGSLTDSLRLEAITPTRIVDSRSGLGTSGPLGQGSTATITTPANVATADTEGLALNVTAIAPSSNTFMTVWPNGLTRPVVSNLNPSAGQIVPNAVVAGLDVNDRFNVYNNGGTVHFVVDVVGRFYWYPYGAMSATADGARALKPAAAGVEVRER